MQLQDCRTYLNEGHFTWRHDSALNFLASSLLYLLCGPPKISFERKKRKSKDLQSKIACVYLANSVIRKIGVSSRLVSQSECVVRGSDNDDNDSPYCIFQVVFFEIEIITHNNERSDFPKVCRELIERLMNLALLYCEDRSRIRCTYLSCNLSMFTVILVSSAALSSMLYGPFALLHFWTKIEIKISAFMRSYCSQTRRKKFPFLWSCSQSRPKSLISSNINTNVVARF